MDSSVTNLNCNPFLIELILQIIFTYLPEENLKICRLVCWEWNRQATRAIQNWGRCIVFGGLYKVNVFQIRPDLERIRLFMSAMENSENVPYANFELRPNMFAPQNKELLMEFLMRYGSVIQKLHVNLAYESADSFLKDCLQNVQLPKLSSLEFSNSLRGELRPNLHTSLLTTRSNLLFAIMDASPNLENIVLWCDGENVVWPGEVFDVLCMKKLPYLNSLKISFPSNTQQISRLLSLNAQLSSLIFILREPIFDHDILTSLLLLQSKTLKYLKIVDLQCSNYKDIKLPIMDQLKTFVIEGAYHGENCAMSFVRFSYKQLPKLERLVLSECLNFNVELKPFFFNFPCFSLKQLQIELSNEGINANFLESISDVFPNLKIICILFTPESKDLLQCVFETLAYNIKYMTLDLRKCRVNLDDVMTGISKENLEKLISKEREENSPFEKVRFGISFMKNLKSLIVKGDIKTCEPRKSLQEFSFTDITANYGITALPRLKYLRIPRSGFTEGCLQKLASKYDFVKD